VRAQATATVRGHHHRVAAVVADLATWPAWLDVVTRARPAGDGAWQARLGLRLGPLDLGFDLRMVRVSNQPGHIRFERDEADGRHHSPVVIDVVITPAADGTVALALDVDIGKRVPLLDLQREVDRRAAAATGRLQSLVGD
jgi:Polyketide cyclase / dehydrase and lipid transport